jgi:hypothetical protein
MYSIRFAAILQSPDFSQLQDITDTFLGTSIPLIPPTEDELFWRHEFGMLLCAPLLLALGFARNLDNLKWTSAGGSFLVVLCLIFVVLELLSRPQYEYDPDLEVRPSACGTGGLSGS